MDFQLHGKQVSLQGVTDGHLAAMSSSQLNLMQATHAIAKFYHLQMSTPTLSSNSDYYNLYPVVLP